MKRPPTHGPQIESILQHAIDKNRPADDAPDTRDGIDLLVIILSVWFVCMIAGYVIGRN